MLFTVKRILNPGSASYVHYTNLLTALDVRADYKGLDTSDDSLKPANAPALTLPEDITPEALQPLMDVIETTKQAE